MEDVTRSVLAEEILKRLDLENLCSVACVSTTLRSAVVSGVLPSLTSLDLSVCPRFSSLTSGKEMEIYRIFVSLCEGFLSGRGNSESRDAWLHRTQEPNSELSPP